MGILTLDVSVFIEHFNLATCEATSRITHFSFTTQYNGRITTWSMEKFTPFFLFSNESRSNRTTMNLLLREMTQISPYHLKIFFASFLHFPSAILQQKWSKTQIGENKRWMACNISGFSKCNVNENGNDYHLISKQDACLIFCPAEMEIDRYIISQDKNTTTSLP